MAVYSIVSNGIRWNFPKSRVHLQRRLYGRNCLGYRAESLKAGHKGDFKNIKIARRVNLCDFNAILVQFIAAVCNSRNTE